MADFDDILNLQINLEGNPGKQKDLENALSTYNGLLANRQKTQESLTQAILKGDQAAQESATKQLGSINQSIKTLEDQAAAYKKIQDAKGDQAAQNESYLKLVDTLGLVTAGVTTLYTSIIAANKYFLDATESANNLRKQLLSVQEDTGITAREFLSLQKAIELGGKSSDGAEKLLINLQKKIVELAQASPQAEAEFGKLNLKFQDLANLNPNQQLELVLSRLKDLPPGLDRSSEAAGLFGTKLTGSAIAAANNLEKAKGIVDEFGLTLNDVQNRQLADFSIAVTNLQSLFEGLKNLLGSEYAEVFTTLATEAKEAILAFKSDPKNVEGLKDLLDVLKSISLVLGQETIVKLKEFTVFLSNTGIVLKELGDLKPSELFDKISIAIGAGQVKLQSFKDSLISVIDVTRPYRALIGQLADVFYKQADAITAANKALDEHKEKLDNTKTSAQDVATSQAQLTGEYKKTIESLNNQEKALQISAINQKAFIKQTVTDKQQAAVLIAAVETKLAADTITIQRSIVDATRKAVSDRVATAKELNDQILKLEDEQAKQREAKANEVEKARDQVNANRKQSLQITLDAISASEQKHHEELTALLAKGAINEQQYNNAIVTSHIEALDAKLKATLQNLEKAKQAEGKNKDEIAKLELDASKDSEALALAKFNQQKNLDNQLLQQKLTNINLEKEARDLQLRRLIDNGASEQEIEEKRHRIAIQNAHDETIAKSAILLQLEKEGAAIEQIRQAQLNLDNALQTEKELRNQILGTIRLSGNELAAVEQASLKRGEDFLKQAKDAQDLINGTLEQFKTHFDAANQTIAQGNAELLKMRETFQAILEDQALQGPGSQAIFEAITDEASARIKDFQNDLIKAQQEASKKAAQDLVNQRVAAEQSADQAIKSARDSFLADLASAEINHNNTINGLQQSRLTAVQNEVNAEKDAFEKLNSDKEQLAANLADKLKSFDDQTLAAAQANAQALIDTIRTTISSVANELGSVERQAIVAESNAKKALEKAQADLAKDPKNAQKIQAVKDAQAQLAGLQADDQAQQQLLKDKQAAIDKARQESSSKDEFDAKAKAIEDNYNLDKEALAERKQLLANGDKDAIAALDASIAEQKKRRQADLDAQLKELKANADLAQKQRDDQRQAIINDYNKQLTDLQAAYDKQRLARLAAYEKTLADIDAQTKKENEKYQAQVDSIKSAFETASAKAAQTLTGLSNNVDGFVKNSLEKYGILGDEIDKIIAKYEELKKVSGGASGGGNKSSSSSSTTTGSSSSSSSSTGQSQPNNSINSSGSSSSGGSSNSLSRGGNATRRSIGDDTGNTGNGNAGNNGEIDNNGLGEGLGLVDRNQKKNQPGGIQTFGKSQPGKLTGRDKGAGATQPTFDSPNGSPTRSGQPGFDKPIDNTPSSQPNITSRQLTIDINETNNITIPLTIIENGYEQIKKELETKGSVLYRQVMGMVETKIDNALRIIPTRN